MSLFIHLPLSLSLALILKANRIEKGVGVQIKKRYRVTKQLHIIFIRASSSIDFLLSLIFRMESGNLVVFFSLRHLISQFHDYLNDQAGLLRDVYAKRHTIPFSLDGSISETHFRVRRFQYVYSVLVRALDHHSKCKC